MSHSAQSKGGKARAENLTPERRREIARKAAASRWDKDLPEAILEGSIPLGDSEIACAIVGTDTRIIAQASFLRSLGRARSPKAGTGVLSTVDEPPFFLASKAFSPFIDQDLLMSTKPILYRTSSGGKGIGYDARALPSVAEVYLRFRDYHLKANGSVPARYERMVQAADLVVRSLAQVGIIALVDEATGYQDVRAKDALAKILQHYLAEERQKWAPTFPLDFYKEIYRLRGWEWKPWTTKKPQVIAHWTNDFVYDRLAPGITEELRTKNPTTRSGQRAAKHHQWFNPQNGHPALREHIAGVIALMKGAENWDSFRRTLDRVFTRYNETLEFAFTTDGTDQQTKENPQELHS